MSLVEEHEDILQNIEFAIVSVYREHPRTLMDTAVMRALDAATAYYNTVRRGHEPKPVKLSDDAMQVFERIKNICDLRLGRAPEGTADEALEDIMGDTAPDAIVACLRRIRKSVDRWNKQGGRQGYLIFVSQFIR